MRILKFLLATGLKRSSKTRQKAGGFTLIELLAAMVLAALVIAPLLGFLVDVMNTDRQEQAKTSSAQELQAAMDYITRDLQQAVYIYDKAGVASISSQLPSSDDEVPVLVFWKRKLLEASLPPNTTTNCNTAPEKCNDAFVYALVAYYLIKDNEQPWSGASRIGRFEIQDAVRYPDGKEVDRVVDNSNISRDSGFKLFDLEQPGDLTTKMNSWEQEDDETYTKQVEVLVDYIDQSTAGVPSEECPADSDPTGDTDPEWTPVPDYSVVDSQFKTHSFYACVYSSKITARVFIRGNALARIRDRNNIPTYSSQASGFFPRARIEVTGSGALRSK